MVLEKNVRDGILMRVVIVEDNNEDAKHLTDCLNKFSKSHGVEFQIVRFDNANDFMAERKLMADLVFMDILMPLPDGMKAAERLRRVDESVCLIFVTNMAQLAIRGYKVGATDFLVKPVSYFDFSMEMDKIVRAHERRANDSIWVSTAGSMRRVAFSDICYIEILMHDVVIHTESIRSAPCAT